MAAREPSYEDLAQTLLQEIAADAKELAPALFSGDQVFGAHEVKKPDFLRYVRQAWTHGVGQTAPAQWRQQFLERWGPENFLKYALEAFELPSIEKPRDPRNMSLEERVALRLQEEGLTDGADDTD